MKYSEGSGPESKWQPLPRTQPSLHGGAWSTRWDIGCHHMSISLYKFYFLANNRLQLLYIVTLLLTVSKHDLLDTITPIQYCIIEMQMKYTEFLSIKLACVFKKHLQSKYTKENLWYHISWYWQETREPIYCHNMEAMIQLRPRWKPGSSYTLWVLKRMVLKMIMSSGMDFEDLCISNPLCKRILKWVSYKASNFTVLCYSSICAINDTKWKLFM